MDSHVRIFGTLTIVYAVAALALSLGALAYTGGFAAFFDFAEDVTGFGAFFTGLLVLNLCLAPPSIVAAIQLRRFREWARSTLTVISGLNILNVPIAPVLGAYGLWVLLSPETEPLFSDPAPHLRARAAEYARMHPAKPREAAAKQNPIPTKADLQP